MLPRQPRRRMRIGVGHLHFPARRELALRLGFHMSSLETVFLPAQAFGPYFEGPASPVGGMRFAGRLIVGWSVGMADWRGGRAIGVGGRAVRVGVAKAGVQGDAFGSDGRVFFEVGPVPAVFDSYGVENLGRGGCQRATGGGDDRAHLKLWPVADEDDWPFACQDSHQLRDDRGQVFWYLGQVGRERGRDFPPGSVVTTHRRLLDWIPVMLGSAVTRSAMLRSRPVAGPLAAAEASRSVCGVSSGMFAGLSVAWTRCGPGARPSVLDAGGHDGQRRAGWKGE